MSAGNSNGGGAGLRGPRRRTMFSLAGGTLLLGIAGLTVTAGAQPTITDDDLLRIASWNLLDAVGAGVIKRKKRVQKSWRNTFGAERRIASRPKFAGDKLGADIVLLQGVKSIREVRQIFPARYWKLILSRQVLRQNRGRINADTVLGGSRTTTAVAVRYQRGLRVTGYEHLLDLGATSEKDADTAKPNAAETQEAVPAPRTATAEKPSPPAGMALRIAHGRNNFWVVSVVLPDACRLGNGTCRSADELTKWADGKRKLGLGVVFGGRLAESLRQAGPSGTCAEQEIVADRVLTAEAGADAIAGCVAFVELTRRPASAL
jgi:hypothetical protein